MFRSAIFKLTAAYVGIVMSVCIIFSVVLDRVAVRELHTGFYNQYTRLYDAYVRLGLRTPATPAQELSIRSHTILMQIIYLNLVLLVLTTIISYLLARRTLRPIQMAHEQQKRFTADVSHELRTPLTALKMEAEVALMDPKLPARELRETLRSNLEEVSRMESLINNLLLLSSMEADKLRTHFTVLDLADIVTTASDSLMSSASAADVQLTTKVEHILVRGDRASLTQLFVILLSNAIKYSPAGDTVTISIRKSRYRATVEISDNGSGIPAGDLPHVFDRFYRADNSRSRSLSGTASAANPSQGFGIGLSLAKLIADLHTGEIVITSTTGAKSGTTVEVHLSRKI